MKSIPNCHEVKSYCQERIETHELGAQVDLLTGGIVKQVTDSLSNMFHSSQPGRMYKALCVSNTDAERERRFSIQRHDGDINQGGSSHVGMSLASVKAAENTQSSSSTRKKSSSRTPWGKADTWRGGSWAWDLTDFTEKFSTIKGSPTVTRRKGYTKELCCSSVSYKNDNLIYP